MKNTTLLVAVAAAGTVGLAVAAPAAAEDAAPTVTQIGQQAELVNGPVVQGWTVYRLQPSSDAIPYPVQGTLWEIVAIDEAISGAATPIVSDFNARSGGGETYRALFGAATAQGVNPSTLAEGQQVTGKVYFDVTGDDPDSVVYNAFGRDLIVWEQPQPEVIAEDIEITVDGDEVTIDDETIAVEGDELIVEDTEVVVEAG